MVQESTDIEINFFASGYCTAHAAVVDPVKGRGKSKFYAVWALIQHPVHGAIMVDTGYAERFYEATRNFPERLYAWVTPVTVRVGESAVSQLKALRIQPADIRYIIVSHFHADHIGGLMDFPQAKFICSRKSFDEMNTRKGLAAVCKGILKKLIPSDFNSRVNFIEDMSVKKMDEKSGLFYYHLFDDEHLKIFELPGHARGMVGIEIETKNQKLFFATDASWSMDTFRRKLLPSKVIKLFIDRWDDYVDTFQKLYRYQEHYPKVKILFTHCPETIVYINKNHV